MRKDADVSDIDLAEDYTAHLRQIGEEFLRFFRKRGQTLPLHIQIVCGIDGWETILKAKPYLANAHDDHGRVPLMVYYHSFIYETLLKYGADPNAVDSNGNTVLMYHRNNPELVEVFVRAGADINATNNAGESLVAMALKEGLPIYPFVKLGATLPSIARSVIDRSFFLGCLQREPVEVLSGLFSDSLPSENTFLHAKIWSGCLDQDKFEWVKSLGKHYSIQRKAEFSVDEQELFTKDLNSRIHGEDSKLFDELIANMDECLSNRNPIYACIRKDKGIVCSVRNPAILEFLLRAGADPNGGKVWKEDTDWIPPLYTAVRNHDRDLVRLLLAYGADPDTGTTYMDTDDTCVARAVRDNELEILRLLIKARADLNFAIRCTRTPIRTAISTDNLPALKMLIEAGADPCLPDQFGATPDKILKENNNSPELIRYFKTVVARRKKKTANHSPNENSSGREKTQQDRTGKKRF